MDEKAAAAALDRLVAVSVIDGLAEADLVVEAVLEDYRIRSELISKLDEICEERAILATNTSTPPVTQLDGFKNLWL